jgi:hypothetical protein
MQNDNGDLEVGEEQEGALDHSEGDAQSARPQRSAPPPPERRRPPANAHELMLEEVKARAQRAGTRLRECLLGTLLIELTNGKKFGFDWRQAELVVVPLEGELKGVGAADCTIRLSEDNLMRVASGDLNPQVGMLSDKIRVQGKVSFAVYFFNLVAPRPHS